MDTLDLKAERLPPNTSFTVFLNELAEFPFGGSEYIPEFTTNAAGRGSVRVDAVIEEAFAFDGITRVTCNLGNMSVGATSTFQIAVKVDGATNKVSISNTAAAVGLSSDPNPANSAATVTTQITGNKK